MPPNTIEVLPYIEPKVPPISVEQPKPVIKENYALHICQASLNMIGRLCIGIIVGVCLMFAFRGGLPLNAVNLHVVLCVIGYQLLMAEACLVLAPGTWASNLTLVDKRRVHWILQLVGSILAIVGSVIKSVDNTVNWNSLHGKFGIVAVGFTGLSLINGFTSLYAHELRRIFPGSISKITHICFGVVAFLTACVSLIYGFERGGFGGWMPNTNLRQTLVGITSILIIVVTVNPLITFYQKSKRLMNR